MVWPIKFCFKVILENVFWNIYFFEIILEAGKGMSGQHMLWEFNFCCYRIAVSTSKKKKEKKIEQGRVISFNEETCLTYLDAFVMNIIYQHSSNQNPSHGTWYLKTILFQDVRFKPKL